MKSRSSKGWPCRLLVLVAGFVTGPVLALDFKAVDVPVTVLYDAPSLKGKKLFLLKRYTPVELIVSAEGFAKVREPEGAIGWVEKKALSDKRQVLVNVPKAQVRGTAGVDAAIIFEAEKGVALELLEPARDGWAKVRHLDGPTGMIRVTQVWGL